MFADLPRPVVRCLRRLAVLVLICIGVPVCAQDYPSKAVRLIVPFAAGGGNDSVARVVAQQLSRALGQQVIVDNRPGAGGVVGAEAAAKAAPDGYTLFLGGVGSLAVNPVLIQNLPYDALKDFQPIILIASAPSVLVVHPSVPVNTVEELITLARTHPGQVNYASNGNGSSAQIAAVMFETTAGLDLVHVPYKGLSPALNDLLSGRVEMMFSSVVAIMPQIKAGKLRPLAVTSPTRAALLPEVPTLAESGLPDYRAGSWYGLLAPAGTPPEIINRINAATQQALDQPGVRAQLASEGADPIGGTPEDFTLHIRAELARMKEVVQHDHTRLQ